MAYGYDYYPYQQTLRRSAPASVHTVAILQYLGGLALLLVAGLMAVVAGGRLNGSQVPDFVRTGAVPVAGVFAFVGLVVIALGRKLQRGRQGARVLVIVLSVFSVAGTLYDGLAATGTHSNVLGGLVFPVLYLVLLNTPAARSWFRSHTY
jgi:hypothetical protein